MTSGTDPSLAAPGGKAVEMETVGEGGFGAGIGAEASSEVSPSSGSDGWVRQLEPKLGEERVEGAPVASGT
jgi:hypothetical protein